MSSYVGPVLIDPDAPKGAVYEIDTLSLAVTRKVTVGYQPEEMEVVDDYMYVANSGGYRAPDYDNTVSVIEMIDFKQVRQIPVGINLHRLNVTATASCGFRHAATTTTCRRISMCSTRSRATTPWR